MQLFSESILQNTELFTQHYRSALMQSLYQKIFVKHDVP